ncbi:hypothetical protein CDV31_012115 [Fusarium ambrosium]|uniref:DNL-type domain-containing protein n=1 Tax=Fusarium ambrosium TaxID=131363 RepID=A0A428TBZ8_9HYPO|nr:hypothetical protein CDV31_012115 [Fusarium ambrosium]
MRKERPSSHYVQLLHFHGSNCRSHHPRPPRRIFPALDRLSRGAFDPRPPTQKYAQPNSEQSQTGEQPKSEGERPEIKPSYYQLSFTCVPCGHRSHHNVSKQGYHHGSTLITCPECRNRHVISDHLNIFGDRKITVEDLMREKGQLVKRGSLGEDGDIEFWPEESLAQSEEGTGKTETS